MLLPQRDILKTEAMQLKAIYLQLLFKKVRKFIRSELRCHSILSLPGIFRMIALMPDRFKKTLVNLRDNLDVLVWNTQVQLNDHMSHYQGLIDAALCKSLTLIAWIKQRDVSFHSKSRCVRWGRQGRGTSSGSKFSQQDAVIFNWKACEAAAHPSTVGKLQSFYQEWSN